MTYSRRLLGDIALACLLALPTIAFSRPQPSEAQKSGIQSPVIERAANADRLAAAQMTHLPG